MSQSLLETATFAGGCFWCLEADFRKVPGVIEVVSGYCGGIEPDPTYEQVCSGRSGHLEAVQVRFDPSQVGYETLLDWFWKHIDPTDGGGQFVDRGPQYRPAVFYHSPKQRELAEASRRRLEGSGRFSRAVAVEIHPFEAFYPAEPVHQGYAATHATHYRFYRHHSGRDQFLQAVWSDMEKPASNPGPGWTRPTPEELQRRLSPMQYRVTQEEGTEPPFDNAYWDNKSEGIYVDAVSGEPLFCSRDKYDSGTGWPSFTRPLEPGHLVEREDRSLMRARTEVRSRLADSHLGHVFADGPPPTGLRYCMNSAAMRFVPRDEMEKHGYGDYLRFFS